MDLSRFKECSAAFGADKRRWPPHDQVLYDRVAQTPDGMAILAEVSRTDHFLDALTSALPDSRRARHVAVLAMPAWRRLGIAAAALAASALLGFMLGYLQTHTAADTGAVAQLLLGPQSLEEIGL